MKLVVAKLNNPLSSFVHQSLTVGWQNLRPFGGEGLLGQQGRLHVLKASVEATWAWMSWDYVDSVYEKFRPGLKACAETKGSIFEKWQGEQHKFTRFNNTSRPFLHTNVQGVIVSDHCYVFEAAVERPREWGDTSDEEDEGSVAGESDVEEF